MDQRIVDTLHDLARSNNGTLTPDAVVTEAKKKTSPLHEYFAKRDAWDAKKAQANYCIIIARDLIRSVRVEVTTTEFDVKAPAFIRDPSVGNNQGYASLSRLRGDADLAREVLVAEFSRAGAAMARAKAVAAALNLTDEIETIRASINALSERVSPGH